MTPGLRRAGVLLFAVVAVGVVVWNLIPQADSVAPDAASPSFPASPTTPADVRGREAPPGAVDIREYALGLEELQGFPPDAAPGTEFELWVTWDRPDGGAPRLQRLVRRVALVRVVPPITPGGPTAAVMAVPTRRVPDLLYADAYGAISVTVLST